VVTENVKNLLQCGIKVPSLLHLICTMLIDMGGNWGFEGQCHGNSIKTCQYSLSRFYGFCGLVSMPPLVNLSPTRMLSIMFIGDLSNTPADDDYNMHSNLLSIVWTGDSFNEVGKKKGTGIKSNKSASATIQSCWLKCYCLGFSCSHKVEP
jgi:hypothetical protein